MDLNLTEMLIAIACPILGFLSLIGLMHYLARFHNEPSRGRRSFQFTLSTLLFVVLAAAVITYMYRDGLLRLIDGGLGVSHSRMTTIANVRQLNEALASEKCILLIDADWDFYSIRTHQSVEEFLRSRHRYEDVPRAPVYCVNITDAEGPVFRALSRWSATAMPEAKNRGPYAGTGAVLWVSRGVVKDSLPYGDDAITRILVAKSRRAFPR